MKAFSVLELIFVIVIIGILAGVSIPRLFSNIDDAYITKAKMEIEKIKAAIASSYSKNIMAGKIDECPDVEKSTSDNTIFEAILPSPIKTNQKEINWTFIKKEDNFYKYKLKVNNKETTFTYEKDSSKDCPFYCDDNDFCKTLTQ